VCADFDWFVATEAITRVAVTVPTYSAVLEAALTKYVWPKRPEHGHAIEIALRITYFRNLKITAPKHPHIHVFTRG
jgi:hypothetical protein